MNLATEPKRFSTVESISRPVAVEPELCHPRPLSRLQGRGRDYRSGIVFPPPPRLAARRVPAPEVTDAALETPQPEVRNVQLETVPPAEVTEVRFETSRRGLLGGLFAWLRGGRPAAKQLRLAEIVALGEKRFVAIIHAEGQKYLVGGGASGVALLTRLDEATKTAEALSPFKQAIEASR